MDQYFNNFNMFAVRIIIWLDFYSVTYLVHSQMETVNSQIHKWMLQR